MLLLTLSKQQDSTFSSLSLLSVMGIIELNVGIKRKKQEAKMKETWSHQTLTRYASAGFLGSDICNYQPQIYAEHLLFRESNEF